MTKGFASQTFEPVAIHGPPGRAARDGESETRPERVVGAGEHGEVPIRRAGRLGENSAELGRGQKTAIRWKRRSQKRTDGGSALRGKDGLDPSLDVDSIPCGLRESTCEHESRACACGADCWAETFFSCRGDLAEKLAEKQPDGWALASRQIYAPPTLLSIEACAKPSRQLRRNALHAAVDNRGQVVLDLAAPSGHHP